MSYHWTDDAANIARLANAADAIELAACIDTGNGIEQAEGLAPDLYSVYFHFPADRGELTGADCIADRDSYAAARHFADMLANRHGLPVHDYAECAL